MCAVLMGISMLYVILQDEAGFEVFLIPRPVTDQLGVQKRCYVISPVQSSRPEMTTSFLDYTDGEE